VKVDSSNLQVLYKSINDAIAKNQNIQFNYQKSMTFSNGEQSKRTIKPAEFERIGISGSLCIKGFCFMKQEERTFALERISNLVINPAEIEYWEKEKLWIDTLN